MRNRTPGGAAWAARLGMRYRAEGGQPAGADAGEPGPVRRGDALRWGAGELEDVEQASWLVQAELELRKI